MADPTLRIRITGDLTAIRNSLAGLQADLVKLSKNAATVSSATSRGMSRMESSIADAKRALGSFAAAYAALRAVSTITGLADQYAQLNGVLKLATGTTEEFRRAQKGVYDIAQATRAPVKETADTYSALERNTRALGLSQGELLRTLETVNKSIGLTPVSAQAAQAALVQFGQALGGDFKAGSQELNSILEQTPGLAISIAQGLGVEVSALKRMGEQGRLSTELVVRGLLRISDAVDQQFAKVPLTISGTLQQLRNDLLVTLGRTDMSGLIGAMQDLRATVTDPAVVAGLLEIASGITAVATAATKVVAAVGGFARWIGEELSARINGVADDDLPRLSEAIGRVNEELSRARGHGGVLVKVNADVIKRLEAERDDLKKRYDIARQAADAAATKAVKAPGDRDKKTQNEKAEADYQAAQARAAAEAAKKAASEVAGQRIALARAQADAEFAVLKDSLDRQASSLEASLDDRLISLRDYYATKTALETREIDAEIARQQALLAEQQRQASAGGSEGARLKARAEVAGIEAELIVLNNRRADVETANARRAAAAERDLQDDLAKVRDELLDLTDTASDDDRRASIERSYRDLRARLVAESDLTGVALVDRLINVKLAQSRLDDIRRRTDEAIRQMQQAEQTSAARAQAGGDPAVAAREQRAAREEAAVKLQAIRAELQGLPQDTQGAEEALQQLDQAIGEIAVQNMTGFERAVADLRAQLAQLQEDFAGDALTSLRDGLAGFFTSIFDGSKSAGEALKDFVRGFGQSMAQLAARALATFLLLQTLDAIYPGLGRATAATLGAGVKHSGGMAGHGMKRRVPAWVFAVAPRFHDGGVAGLAPGEVPAILQTGERVLSREETARYNTGDRPAPGTRIVNVFDPSFVPDQMDSASGERVILNVIGRNPGRVRQLLG